MYAAVKDAKDYAQLHKTWVVVLVPDAKFDEASTNLISMMDPNTMVSGGRTLVMDGNARVTIVQTGDALDVPPDFHFMAAGWGDSQAPSKEMDRWRMLSTGGEP